MLQMFIQRKSKSIKIRGAECSRPDFTRDRQTICSDIRPVQLPDGTDLYGYYYKHYASDDDAANGIYTYRYISLQDKYFFKSGATPPSGLEGIRENEFYEYDSELKSVLLSGFASRFPLLSNRMSFATILISPTRAME